MSFLWRKRCEKANEHIWLRWFRRVRFGGRWKESVQFLCGKNLFKLSLIVFFLVGIQCAPRISPALKTQVPEPLVDRINSLFRILKVLRVNHYETRSYIRDFFLNDQDLDRFVVQTTLRLIQARVYDMLIRDFRIKEVRVSGRRAVVRVEFWGSKRFPLFKGKSEEVQQWVLRNGRWYLEPPQFFQ